jgi:rare lipoprotein A
VTELRIVDQRRELDESEARLSAARSRYRKRLVEVYKRGSFDPLSLLLSADTLSELVSRAGILTRITESDSQVVADLNIAAADARYQQASLEELQAQDRTLKHEHEVRLTSLADMLAEQELLIAKLSAEARDALLQTRRFTAETRQQWRLNSIPIGAEIPRATATVDSHPDVTYLVSAYMPRQYHATGQGFAAVCSWYGPGFNGRGTASGQVFNEDDFTCASRTLPFGTLLALTRGDRRVIVYVNDRGPYIAGRDLDLSKAAATALGFSGVATVQAEVITAIQ